MPPAPLTLDPALADQVFTADSADDAQAVREMFVEFEKDIPVRVARLRVAVSSIADDAAVRELHQVRGVIANLGMAAAGELLRAVEKEWRAIDVRQRQDRLVAAEAEIARALEQIRTRFPHVNSPGAL